VCECGQIQRISGLWYSADYSTFSISDEAGNYRLTVAGYSGDAGDAMVGPAHVNFRADGYMFSTPDRDNDIASTFNCAAYRLSGWWFGWCTLSDLNLGTMNGLWKEDIPDTLDVTTSRMMLKIV